MYVRQTAIYNTLKFVTQSNDFHIIRLINPEQSTYLILTRISSKYQ